MKKLTLLLLAALSGLTATAQTEKGSHLLGGSFAVSHNKGENTYSFNTNQQIDENRKQNSFSLGPSYSYFVADKLGLNVNLGYNHSHLDDYGMNRDLETTSNGYFGSIALNKYFLYENKVGIRTGPYATYGASKSKTTSPNDEYNDHGESKDFNTGISLEFVYFPVKKIGLVAHLGGLSYAHNSYESSTNSSKHSQVGLNFLNSSTSFSFYYVLGNK